MTAPDLIPPLGEPRPQPGPAGTGGAATAVPSPVQPASAVPAASTAAAGSRSPTRTRVLPAGSTRSRCSLRSAWLRTAVTSSVAGNCSA